MTVVVPVFNAGRDLDLCLAAVTGSDWPHIECIVVDDASTDGMTDATARRYGARVIRLETVGGPGRARSVGVSAASSEIIFFTDADVVLHPDAISIGMSALIADPQTAAVFGSYDDKPAAPGFLSQYRNLLHHWTHQSGPENASTFWTGCGAIRREVFLRMNAFSAEFNRPSVEDIEFGYRMTEAGYRIRLLKNMQGTHLKSWRFGNMLATDVFRRGVPWMMLLLRHPKVPANLNVGLSSRVATVLAGLFALSLTTLIGFGHWRASIPALALMLASAACAWIATLRVAPVIRDLLAGLVLMCVTLGATTWAMIRDGDAWALLPLALIAGMVAITQGFYRFLQGRRGWAFALAAVWVQVIFYLGCVVAVPLGGLAYLRNRAQRDDRVQDSGLSSGH